MTSLFLKIIQKTKRYRSMDDFVAWAKEHFDKWLIKYFDYDMYPYNRETAHAIIESLIRNSANIFVIEYSRQMGKTITMSYSLCYLAFYLPKFYEDAKKFGAPKEILEKLEIFKNGFFAGIFAPGERQARIAYDRTREIVEKMATKKHLNLDMNSKTRFQLTNKSTIQLFPASKTARLEGYTLHVLYCDESSYIPDTVLKKSILPMGAQMYATKVFTGTPALSLMQEGESCRFFYDLLHDKQTEVVDPKKNFGKIVKFIHNWEVGAKYSDRYRSYVLSDGKLLGKDSEEFKTSYLLQWIVESLSFTNIEKIIALENVSKDRGLTRIKTKTMKPNGFPYESIYFGCDAGQTPDPSILTIGELQRREDGLPELIILDWLEIGGGVSYKDQAKMIYEKLARYALRAGSLDVTGQSSGQIGSAFMDLIKMEFARNPALRWHEGWYFKPVHMTQAKQHELWVKLHELWINSQILFPCPSEPEYRNFRHQFEVLGYEYRNGYLRCDHPKKDHNDYCSSLALLVDAIGVDFKRPEQVPQRSVRDMVRFSGGAGVDRNPFGAVSPGEIPGMGDGRRPEQF